MTATARRRARVLLDHAWCLSLLIACGRDGEAQVSLMGLATAEVEAVPATDEAS